MQYSDKDILDLETSLEGIGLETQIKYGLLKSKDWRSESNLNFQNAVCCRFLTVLQKEGITLKSSFMVKEKQTFQMVSLEGPSIRTTRLMEKISEKFGVEDVLQFV